MASRSADSVDRDAAPNSKAYINQQNPFILFYLFFALCKLGLIINLADSN